MTSPNCVLTVSACDGDSLTVTVSELSPNFEHGIHQQGAVDVHGDAGAPIGPESGDHDIDIVVANRQAGEGVHPRAVGGGRLPDARIDIGRGHRGFGDHRARAILNGSGNAAPHVRARHCGKPGQESQGHQQEDGFYCQSSQSPVHAEKPMSSQYPFISSRIFFASF